MSESFKEHRPLLCDDYSDEELRFGISNPKFRRFRHSTHFGRARTHAIGAAAIINRWPDHLSSLLSYWWIGAVMMVLIIFVLYNSMITISALPSVHPRPLKLKTFEPYDLPIVTNENFKTKIFMHVFATEFTEVKNKYFRIIDEFSNKYSDFQFNVIVILKDGLNDSIYNLSDELNNEIALNSLWIENKNEEKIKLNKNTNVQIVSLIKYMDDSPLKKIWRHLPQHFFGFLARCIAIWEKGGIALDPLILTRNSPNITYLQKIEQIFNNFGSSNEKLKANITKIAKKKVNNIRDIIENLENIDKTNVIENSLAEAESKHNLIEIINLNTNKVKQNYDYISSIENKDVSDVKNNKSKDFLNSGHKMDSGLINTELAYENVSSHKKENQTNDELSNKSNIFPMFLKYLFQQPKNVSDHSNEESFIKNDVFGEEVSNFTSNKVYEKNNKYTKNKMLHKKVFRKKNSRTENTTTTISTKNNINYNSNIHLTIDLKGSLIATNKPCHAFIGTIFSNVFHYSYEDSITDLIIAELSIFCKGVLTLCGGVDVILI